MTVTSFNMAEKYRTPVILLLDEITAHTREKIFVPEPDEFAIFNRTVPAMPPEWYKPFEETVRGVPPMPPLGSGYRFHTTGLTHDVNGFPTQRPDEIEDLMLRLFRKIDQFYPDIQLVDDHQCEDAEIIVVAYGSVARSARLGVDMARESGVKAGLVSLRTLFPFPRNPLIQRLGAARAVIVPEMNMGQISREVKRVASNRVQVRALACPTLPRSSISICGTTKSSPTSSAPDAGTASCSVRSSAACMSWACPRTTSPWWPASAAPAVSPPTWTSTPSTPPTDER
jgi:2-oxoglutarate ferredoxin oxidoreductase subunit alpha